MQGFVRVVLAKNANHPELDISLEEDIYDNDGKPDPLKICAKVTDMIGGEFQKSERILEIPDGCRYLVSLKRQNKPRNHGHNEGQPSQTGTTTPQLDLASLASSTLSPSSSSSSSSAAFILNLNFADFKNAIFDSTISGDVSMGDTIDATLERWLKKEQQKARRDEDCSGSAKTTTQEEDLMMLKFEGFMRRQGGVGACDSKEKFFERIKDATSDLCAWRQLRTMEAKIDQLLLYSKGASPAESGCLETHVDEAKLEHVDGLQLGDTIDVSARLVRRNSASNLEFEGRKIQLGNGYTRSSPKPKKKNTKVPRKMTKSEEGKRDSLFLSVSPSQSPTSEASLLSDSASPPFTSGSSSSQESEPRFGDGLRSSHPFHEISDSDDEQVYRSTPAKRCSPPIAEEQSTQRQRTGSAEFRYGPIWTEKVAKALVGPTFGPGRTSSGSFFYESFQSTDATNIQFGAHFK